jgi:predicted acylesterase/phospholipase RssA
MTKPEHGLVLQGGGALGAFELGVAEAVYSPNSGFEPGVIAGVSIGAITAALLGRPQNGRPYATLKEFWDRVTISPLLPSLLQPYASLFGLRNFYDMQWLWPWSTSIYSTAPLRATLADLVDVTSLADKDALPRLIFTATDVEAGELRAFKSEEGGLTLDHVLASGSLPPSFPATKIGDRTFWDGGVFDNTPLGAVLDAVSGGDRAVMVVNLFPNEMPLPSNLADVSQHFMNLLFVNKTKSDVKLMRRFDAVARLMDELAALPADSPIHAMKSYQAVADEHYQQVPKIMPVNRSKPAASMEGSDFSAAGIADRAAHGLDAARAALETNGFWAKSPKTKAA